MYSSASLLPMLRLALALRLLLAPPLVLFGLLAPLGLLLLAFLGDPLLLLAFLGVEEMYIFSLSDRCSGTVPAGRSTGWRPLASKSKVTFRGRLIVISTGRLAVRKISIRVGWARERTSRSDCFGEDFFFYFKIKPHITKNPPNTHLVKKHPTPTIISI